MQRRPHVALFINAMAIGHRILAISIVFRHDKEGAPIRHVPRLSIVVKLVDRLERAVGKEHGIIGLIPRRTIGNRDAIQRTVQRPIRMQPKHRALITPLADQRIEHEANPEPARAVHCAIIPAVLIRLSSLNLLIRPHLLDPAVLARLAVADAVTVLSTEDELCVVAFNIGGAAYADVVLLDDFVGRRALGDGDAVQLLLFNVDEADGVGRFFPEGTFAEGAVELEPWL